MFLLILAAVFAGFGIVRLLGGQFGLGLAELAVAVFVLAVEKFVHVREKR